MKKLLPVILMLGLCAPVHAGGMLLRRMPSSGYTVPAAPAFPISDLVSWYKLDEIAGTAAVDYVGDIDATIDSGAWVAGKYGNCLHFTGATNTSSIPTVDGVNAVNAPQTWALYVYSSSKPVAGSGKYAFGIWKAPYSQAYKAQAFGWNDGGNVINYFRNLAPKDDTPTTSYTSYLGSWTHLCSTYDGLYHKFYVDGVAVSTGFITVSINTTTVCGWGIGNPGASEFPMAGKVDEIMFFNKGLSDAEVLQLKNLDLSLY